VTFLPFNIRSVGTAGPPARLFGRANFVIEQV
jgi:hypothetical protein